MTYTAKLKTQSKSRWMWPGALTGSAAKETTYRNNVAIKLIAIH